MSVQRAAAYVRRFPHITRLVLPASTVDLARDLPPDDVEMVSTEAMLVAREGLHPALVNLLLEVVRDAHDDQGYFEAAGEFPNTTQVDIPVAPAAVRHTRFGTSFLYRTFPFWVATFLDRTLILVVPLLVVLVPLINFLPQILRWRVRSRVFRWYGELALLEREVASYQGTPPLAKWTAALDRIERAVTGIRVPGQFRRARRTRCASTWASCGARSSRRPPRRSRRCTRADRSVRARAQRDVRVGPRKRTARATVRPSLRCRDDAGGDEARRSRRRRSRVSRSSSRVCSPSRGAGRSTRGGVAEKWIGQPIAFVGPASGCTRSTTMPRASVCGCVSASPSE